MRTLYKILTGKEWQAFGAAGSFAGSTDDRRDGFIHFSYDDQVAETARRHFAGQSGLVLLAVDPRRFGDALRAEVSRDGALFPHLFGSLALEDVLWHKPLENDRAGAPMLPSLADPAPQRTR